MVVWTLNWKVDMQQRRVTKPYRLHKTLNSKCLMDTKIRR